MPLPILATKLYIPPPRSKVVSRPRLIERLNGCVPMGHKLTLVSAPAGFGKTTLVSEWVGGCAQPIAWLSLDRGESDPARFLVYLVAALRTIHAGIGEGTLAALESPQPPPTESVLTTLFNEITVIAEQFILVLDDYHLVDAKPVDQALAFLLEHQPPQMHVVIATREDPHLPLARLRARGQMAELRAADLRFTPAEAAEFLNQIMGLNLPPADIAALETRTEGWIVGLQLAALSMQGQQDTTSFIKSFTGSHRFVLDYLMEEVLNQQPASVQTFLLRTSILERMCGPLCDAILHGDAGRPASPTASGQATLEHLERANLFVVPLDTERRWYRYHHLFAELLRQRLQQSDNVDELHRCASQWFEDHALEIEAFQHAAAANDIERVERLIEGAGMPVHSLGVVTAILGWLDSLPKRVLETRPWLWVRSATLMLMAGQTTGVEEKLQAAEKAMQGADLDDQTRNSIGQIAAIRATLAILRYQPEDAIPQARRALEYLPNDDLPFRSRAMWTLGFAHQLQGDRAAARQLYREAVAISQSFGNVYHTILASTSLGQIQESDNELFQAAETYRRSLQLLSDQGPPNASEEYFGLARIAYEWNDLDTAESYGQLSLKLARQYDRVIDRFIACEVFLARLTLARGDAAGAAAMLAETERSVQENNFVQRMPEVAAAQVLALLRLGDVAAAARLVQTHDLPVSQARVFLAQGDAGKALAVLLPWRRQAETRGWHDARLRGMVLEAIARVAHGEQDQAKQVLAEALALAEPGGFIRTFVDEGEPMRLLIADFRWRIQQPAHGQDQRLLDYTDKLLAAFAQTVTTPPSKIQGRKPEMIEPLSPRELEILALITQGLSNREIGERLFLALDTVKGHSCTSLEQ